MTTASMTANAMKTGVPHVGPAHHYGRNTGIIFTLLAIVAAMIGYYVVYSHREAAAMDRLARFQALYAARCDEHYTRDTAAMVRTFYVDSSQMQGVVESQLQALEGGASCTDVAKALKAADYPAPRALPGPATTSVP